MVILKQAELVSFFNFVQKGNRNRSCCTLTADRWWVTTYRWPASSTLIDERCDSSAPAVLHQRLKSGIFTLRDSCVTWNEIYFRLRFLFETTRRVGSWKEKMNVLALYFFAVNLWKRQELTGFNCKNWKQPPKRVKRSNYAFRFPLGWIYPKPVWNGYCWSKCFQSKGNTSIDFTELT